MKKSKLSILFICILISFCFSSKSQNTATKYLNRYQAAFEMQDYDGAIEELLKAKELEPKNSQIYLKLGLTYEKQNRYQEAVDAFSKYLVLSPNASNAPEIQKKKDMLEYKMEKSDEKGQQQNYMIGAWYSSSIISSKTPTPSNSTGNSLNQLSALMNNANSTLATAIPKNEEAQLANPFFVFDIIDFSGNFIVKIRSKCPGYQSDFKSKSADARKNEDCIVFSFSSDVYVDPEKEKQNEINAAYKASSIIGNNELGGALGLWGDLTSLIPAEAASTTVRTYIFIVKLNPKTKQMEGSYRETVKVISKGSSNVTKDEIYKITLKKYFTGKAKKEYKLFGKAIGVYDGDFVESIRQGKGTYTIYDSTGKEIEKYTGTWANDMRSGLGEQIWTDGGSFKGLFLNNQMSSGTYAYPDGNQFTGSYLSGQRSGKGKFSYKGKYNIESNYLEDRRHGNATFTFPSGNSMMVNFYNGIMKNDIAVTLSNGNKINIDVQSICNPKNENLLEKIKDDFIVLLFTAAISKKRNDDKFKFEERDIKFLLAAKLIATPQHFLYNEILKALEPFSDSQINRILKENPTTFSLLKSI